jgi:TolB-like protein/Tfp pilus assembly protein PilF
MSFFAELKRRNVFKVGIAYAVATWVLIQIADILLDNFGAPPWVMKSLVLVLAIGFFLALFFAWAYEMTPEGVKRESDVDRSQSLAQQTGQKLNYAIIGLLVLALGYFIWESRFASGPGPAPFDRFSETAAEPFSQESLVQISEAGDEQRDQTPGGTSADSSIAVLPFANRSDEKEDLFFTDGIHDDLLTQLAKIDDLKVISRTSVMKYRGTEKTIPEIAAELGVTTILEGGIQRAGKRIRINAQLIDVATDEHLWAETFDREMTMENIFDIQTEITRQIVTAVKGELSETEQQSMGTVPTGNLAAYEAFLHARAATNRADYSKDKYEEAQPWAEKAVQLDPEFAEAWAILAEIHGQAVWQGYDITAERRSAARDALAKATQLNPGSAAVKASQAEYLYRIENNYLAALAMFRQAHASAPGDARILLLLAITMRRNGLWQESIETFEKSLQLDPDNVFTATQTIDTLIWMNQWDRVEDLLSTWLIKYPDSRDMKGQQVWAKLLHHGDLEAARELFDLLQPWGGYVYREAATRLLNYERNFDDLLVFIDSPEFSEYVQYGADVGLSKGITYYLMGDEEQARKYLQQQIDYSQAQAPKQTIVDAYQLMWQATCWSYLGEHNKALEMSGQAMAMIPRQTDHIFGSEIENNHFLILAMAGKRDEALKRLADTVDKAEGLTRWELHLSPAWDFFRDDERFNELAKPLNLETSGR